LVSGDLHVLGAAGVPFGAAKVEEAEVGFFLWERVSVYAEREFGVCVAELGRVPTHALARSEREAREGMAGIVQPQQAHTDFLGFSAEPFPASSDVPFVEVASGLGAEDELRGFLSLPAQRSTVPLREEIAQHVGKGRGHHNESRPSALGGSEFAANESARTVQTAGLLFQRRSIRDAQSKWRVGAGPVTAVSTTTILIRRWTSRFAR